MFYAKNHKYWHIWTWFSKSWVHSNVHIFPHLIGTGSCVYKSVLWEQDAHLCLHAAIYKIMKINFWKSSPWFSCYSEIFVVDSFFLPLINLAKSLQCFSLNFMGNEMSRTQHNNLGAVTSEKQRSTFTTLVTDMNCLKLESKSTLLFDIIANKSNFFSDSWSTEGFYILLINHLSSLSPIHLR